MTATLTVVIAAKDPPPGFLTRCLASLAALSCAGKLDVVIVLSGELPHVDATIVAAFNSFEVVQTPPKGVYAAYNAGIDVAKAPYVLFLGVDDIALPPFAGVVSILEQCDVDLFAAPCFMEKSGLRQPTTNRRSLIRENWCQQGLFYARTALAQRRFDVRYPIQADHKLNIEIVADPQTRLRVGVEPVAFFSSGGLSSRRHDIAFIRDFPQIVGAHYGPLLGMLYAFRWKLAAWIRGPIEQRYRNQGS
jgi:glycosyltransferase involved in cell wall biosynthesis